MAVGLGIGLVRASGSGIAVQLVRMMIMLQLSFCAVLFRLRHDVSSIGKLRADHKFWLHLRHLGFWRRTFYGISSRSLLFAVKVAPVIALSTNPPEMLHFPAKLIASGTCPDQ